MRTQKIEEFISGFLFTPRYKVHRHTLLILILAIIAIDNTLYLPVEYTPASQIIYGGFVYAFILISAVFINICWAVPKLLLNNRLLLYFLSLTGIIIIAIFLLAILQWSLFALEKVFEEKDLYILFLNLLSSILLVGFLIAGTTTFLIFKYYLISNQRINELEGNTLQTELKYLKNQINPHFLFNMLNNANVLIKEKNGSASQVLLKLEDLLRYQINGSTEDEILLTSDIHFLNDFLNLEKIRRDNFQYYIHAEGEITAVLLPPLLFIPFVENAVKHSQDSEQESYVHLSFNVTENLLQFRCCNSKPREENPIPKVGGLGLKNIKRRLELLFPGQHTLYLKETETEYIVDLQLKYNQK